MSAHEFSIRNFAALHSSGIYSGGVFMPWESDQTGPREVKRAQVLSAPYLQFGKLNTPDKLVFSAASLALSGERQSDGEQIGIALGIPSGSLSTDLDYSDSILNGFPSPALFSATLPSSPIADVAIFFGIKGPDRVFSGGDSCGLATLDAAGAMLATGAVSKVLCIIVWESFADTGRYSFLSGMDQTHDCAVAFLCTKKENVYSGATLKLELGGNRTDKTGIQEQELFMNIIHALAKKESAFISISEKGFKGYISLSQESNNGSLQPDTDS